MKRGELIIALEKVINQLADIVIALKELPAKEAPPDGGKCPIHNVPWKKYPFGWAHPPAKAGEKWCKKPN